MGDTKRRALTLAVALERDEPQPGASLAIVEPFRDRLVEVLPLPGGADVGVFASLDCALVSYTEYHADRPPTERLTVYRMSDWSPLAQHTMDCRAHFNVSPLWSPFLTAPDRETIYIYKAQTLGHHLGKDFVCGLDVRTFTLSSWDAVVPRCLAGWSTSTGRAHAQMLFVADGLESGELPTGDLQQTIAFWLGPQEGMGPALSLGARPRAHSDLGHARAILFAPRRPLSVVVCTDGMVHLIDPVDCCPLERQQVTFSRRHGMPIFAAQLAPDGTRLYVGTAAGHARHQRMVQRIVIHDLDGYRRVGEWVLDEPLMHMTLAEDGRYLYGVSPRSQSVSVLDVESGREAARMTLPARPRYVIPAG